MSNRQTSTLLGLTGGPGAGKDTTAGLLVQHHGFKAYAFADAMRNYLYAVDEGWRHAVDVNGYERAKAEVVGFRDRMVTFGEAAREHIYPEVWIDAVDYRVTPILRTGGSVVVSDVRYSNEAEYIRSAGGIIVGIERPGYRPETDHASDVYLNADDYIFNDGTVIALWAEVDALLDSIEDAERSVRAAA